MINIINESKISTDVNFKYESNYLHMHLIIFGICLRVTVIEKKIRKTKLNLFFIFYYIKTVYL